MMSRNDSGPTGEKPADYAAALAGAPSWITAALIAQTLRVWQPYYPQRLTAADALGMLLDVGQLFGALSRKPVA